MHRPHSTGQAQLEASLDEGRPTTAGADDVLRVGLERRLRVERTLTRARRLRQGTKENASAVALIDDNNLQMPNGVKHCTPRAAGRDRRADGDDRELRRAQIEACTELWRNERS